MTYRLLLACLAVYSVVQGQTSLSLSPVQLDLKIAAGQSAKQTLVIGNDTYGAVRIQADVENWTIGNIGSDVFPAEGAAGLSCRDWITVDHPEFSLKSGERGEVAMRISVPSSAEPGQYLAAVSFKSLAGDRAMDRSGVSIQGQLIAVVFVTVGDPKAEGSIADLTVEKKEGQSVFIVRVNNSGRTFLFVSGKIELRNAKGKKVFAAEIPEDIVPPLSERLLPVIVEKEIAPGNYQAGCVLRLPSRKTLEMKKAIDIH